jgi:DNA-binding MarR family transcriptional regulator/N-acetylglutamate synthase-like GNAT family acetyltransferase
MGSTTLDQNTHAVRRFNRFYTRQIGILEERLYQSKFSLAEVRVLYELAHRTRSTATELGKDLGLDAGYLSRILRSFDRDGLIAKTQSTTDARQSHLTLTPKGRQVFAPLNARSQQSVSALLAALPTPQQTELVRSMESIEKLLGAPPEPKAPYLLRLHQPGDMGWVVHRHGVLYSQEYKYDERFEALVAEIVAEFIQNFDSKRERCWIAERDGSIAGSIFLCQKSATIAKLRLLLVEPSARGLGIGKRLVDECLRFAQHAGYKKIILWTQSELSAARHLYEEAGFRLVKKQKHDSWGRNGLVSETWALKL